MNSLIQSVYVRSTPTLISEKSFLWNGNLEQSRVWQLREFSVAKCFWLVTESSSCYFRWSLSRRHSPVPSQKIYKFREEHKARSSSVCISFIVNGMHVSEIRKLCLSCCMTIHKIKVVCQDSGTMEDWDMSYQSINCMQSLVKSILWILWSSMNHCLCVYLSRDQGEEISRVRSSLQMGHNAWTAPT